MWAGTLLALPPRLVLTKPSLDRAGRAHQELSKASHIYNHGAGWFSCCLQLPVGPAVLTCGIAQCRQEVSSEAPGVFWDKGTAGIPSHRLAVQECRAEPRQ